MKIQILLTATFCFFFLSSSASFPVEKAYNEINQADSQMQISEDNLKAPGVFSDMHWGGFALGFLLGWVGFLLAWIFSKNPYFINSALKGAALWSLIIYIIGEVYWWSSL